MTIDLTRPKEIFFTYSSSKFQMMRDGVFGEYNKYQISTELENEWLAELIENELIRLDINNNETLFPLWYILETNCKAEYLDKIIDFIEKNKINAENDIKLLSFIGKTSEAIDRIEIGCKHNMLLVGRYRKRIENLKEKSSFNTSK